MDNPAPLLALTADITAAYVGNNNIAISSVPSLIHDVHGALARLGTTEDIAPSEPLKPAVSIRASVKPDHLVCLEDGAKMKMLKGYLRRKFDLTPDEYRAKWGLPKDYPMVAPDYAARRSQLAKEIGLGKGGRGGRNKAVA